MWYFMTVRWNEQAMLEKENVIKILKKAAAVDEHLELLADSFDEFYQNWLDGLEENELRQKIDNRRKITGKMKQIK